MKEEQLNVKNVGQIFGLWPDSVFLLSEDGTVETPDERGAFQSLETYYKYEVRGNLLEQQKSCLTGYQPSSLPSTSNAPASLPRGTPLKGISVKNKWPAKPPGVQNTQCNKGEWTKIIEVHRYSASNGLVKFSNFPIMLTEASATTGQICEMLSVEAFSGDKVILLDTDNLEVPDTTASRGIKFWKTNKKIKAISEADYIAYMGLPKDDDEDSDFDVTPFVRKRSKTSPLYVDSSDEDEVTKPKSKGKARLDRFVRIEERLCKLEKPTTTPQGAIIEIKNMFKCVICKNINSVASSLLACCGNLSCTDCLRKWLTSNPNGTCPLCRSPILEGTNNTVPRCLKNLLEILGRDEPGASGSEEPLAANQDTEEPTVRDNM